MNKYGCSACALAFGLQLLCLSSWVWKKDEEQVGAAAPAADEDSVEGPSLVCLKSAVAANKTEWYSWYWCSDVVHHGEERWCEPFCERGCQCPRGKHVQGDHNRCRPYHNQRYFPRSGHLKGGSCRCGTPRFVTSESLSDARHYMSGTVATSVAKILASSTSTSMDWDGLMRLGRDLARSAGDMGVLAVFFISNAATNVVWPNFNFVQGMGPVGGFAESWHFFSTSWNQFWNGHPPEEKWRAPVLNETVGIVTYNEYARRHFGMEFNKDFFNVYYTGNRIPSWEDNEKHARGLALYDAGVRASRSVFGVEPMHLIRAMEPRFAFDNAGLTSATWSGFTWLGPREIKYASNGVHGIDVVERLLRQYGTTDVLGVLMTDSVFSAHLTYQQTDSSFHLDLQSLSQYTALPGYAKMGGRARFSYQGGRLKTKEIHYQGRSYTPTDNPNDASNRDFSESKLSGWRFAEKAVIASLLGMTNLVLHVKDLHLELAAAFQAICVDAFATNPTNPVRRLLDPFIHRSVQATNDNFKLLFAYKAAEFSLAPLPYDQQLELIDDSITQFPLVLANMDMTRYGRVRGIDPASSTQAAQSDDSVWFWRWHYRAKTVQDLYDTMIQCWLDRNYGHGDQGKEALAADDLVQGWWRLMKRHIPSIRRSLQEVPEWAGGVGDQTITPVALKRVLRTLFVWLSWIHEDVGHSAAAFVYNPVHTPMCVPADGEGVPLAAFNFNVAAYRGQVFLDRAKLLDSPPPFWFGHGTNDAQCFQDFQSSLRHLGRNDMAFRECDENGFYSCVDRVETAVSS